MLKIKEIKTMTKFKGFTKEDFNAFVSKDVKLLQRVKKKTKDLVEILSKRLNAHSGLYEYRKGGFAGYISELPDRKKSAFFNIQVNADDLSLEFQIENKDILFRFLKNVDVKVLNDLAKIGDCEIAAWDGNKKVCKFYPDYLNKPDIEFLLDKLRLSKYPIFKFRKIYSRDEARELLNSPKLIEDLIKSMKDMKILFDFITRNHKI